LDGAELSTRLEAALGFLRGQQLPSGEFPTFKARDVTLTQERQLDSTPFATTYVLHALGFAEQADVREMVAPGLDFLEAEMEPHGVWRYWTSKHPQHGFIPPDLDDTCCVSAVLQRFGRSRPANDELILANRNRAGLFYTWLVPRPALTRSRGYWSVTLRQVPALPRQLNFWRLTEASPRDVDCVVNANVLDYLGDRVDAEPVVSFLARALEDGRASCCDKWHLNACAFYYAVSRAYASGVTSLERLRKQLALHAERALVEADGLAPAEVALAACALLNLGHCIPALDEAVRRLAASQGEEGGWPAYALYYGGPNRVYGWGSEALTTGLCVEALSRFVTEPPVGVVRRS
jgi:hypothetical protein